MMIYDPPDTGRSGECGGKYNTESARTEFAREQCSDDDA
jgi:hypothetical protein